MTPRPGAGDPGAPPLQVPDRTPGRLSGLLARGTRRSAPLPGWLEALASFGIASKDPEIVRRQRFTNIFAFASAANVVAHIAAFAAWDLAGLLPLILVDVFFSAALLTVPFLHRFGRNLGAHALTALSVAAILATLFMLGRESQIYVYLALSGIIIFIFGVENPRAYGPWFALTLGALAVSLPLASDLGLLAERDPDLRRLVATHAMMNVAAVNALVIYFVTSNLRRTEIALEDQYDRSAALVSTMLPASIAERLTSDPRRRIADRIDGLSVLFADLAGFTAAARALPPEEIVDYLDEMMRDFDDLCTATGAEKIKTIGDCYMAVGGLDGNGRNGAMAIGRLAIAMLSAPGVRRPLGDRPLALRIGIHAGSATAGIIGDMRFTYDVWGDAVNVAARMESHGLAGRIHVSEAFRDLAGDAFVFEERGETDLRGVGCVRTFFLEGVRAVPQTGPGNTGAA